jgi:hypothetical protein
MITNEQINEQIDNINHVMKAVTQIYMEQEKSAQKNREGITPLNVLTQ